MPFYNPYHFVPVKEETRENDLSIENFKLGDTLSIKNITHDRYFPNSKSGRIICRITTETPTVIGDNHSKDGEFTKVHPYLFEDKPAIPATTLRGMISSLVEASTNSSLRVLDGKTFYSYRKQMETGLSAIGMIVFEEGKPKLRPLTLPTLTGNEMQNTSVSSEYQRVFPVPNLKVYINKKNNFETFKIESPSYFYMKLQKRNWSGNE